MYLVCLLQARPDCRDKLLETLDNLVKHSQTETGTLQYEILVDVEDANRIIVFERYSDMTALTQHLESVPVSKALALFDNYLTEAPVLVKSLARSGFVRIGLANQI